MGLSSSNVCLRSNKSNEKTTLLFIKMSKIIPKLHFSALLWVLWAQNLFFMGPLNLKMGLSSNVCIKSNEKTTLLFIKCQKISQNLIFKHLYWFCGPKIQDLIFGQLFPVNSCIPSLKASTC